MPDDAARLAPTRGQDLRLGATEQPALRRRGRTCGLLVDSEPGQGRHTGRVARVSEADKARMRRQAEDLALLDDDEPGSVQRRRALLDGINALRPADGSEPFADEDEEPPELEFFRRARALGMARIDR